MLVQGTLRTRMHRYYRQMFIIIVKMMNIIMVFLYILLLFEVNVFFSSINLSNRKCYECVIVHVWLIVEFEVIGEVIPVSNILVLHAPERTCV